MDRRYDDRDRQSGGESYRSHGPPRSPRRGKDYRSGRSPIRGPSQSGYAPVGPRHDRRPPSPHSNDYRHRSRSPGFRSRERSPPPNHGSWRGKERSPPRWPSGRDSGRRDDRPRSPPRSGGVRPHSPYGSRSARPRSPIPQKRGREQSPIDARGYRSPPLAKRERVTSPAGNHYNRPRSPIRERDAPPSGPRAAWRPRSRSPPPRHDNKYNHLESRPYARRSPSPYSRDHRLEDPNEASSGRNSGATSRRSSPPAHISRGQQSSGYGSRDMSPNRNGARRPHSPRDHGAYDDRQQSSPRQDARPPPRGPAGYRSPPGRRPEEGSRGGYVEDRDTSHYGGLPTGPGGRNGYEPSAPRGGPPSGPARSFASPAMSPPAGPSSAPTSLSTHNRPSNVSVLSAPRQPRGASGSGPPPSRESSYSGTPHGYRRGVGGGGGGGGSGGGAAAATIPSYGPSDKSPTSGSSSSVPTGPRGSFAPPMFRSNNSSSTTYPRTQRFNNHLAGLPQILPGGKLNPAYEVSDKLKQLEADKKKLEEVLADKETKKRAALRDWDRLERESKRESYKAELAEEQIKAISGDGGFGGAAF